MTTNRLSFFVFSFFLTINIFAQNDSIPYKEVILPVLKLNEKTVILDQAPIYPNGVEGLMEHLRKNIRYPKKAKRKNIQGG